MGFWVDKEWGLKRLASSIAAGTAGDGDGDGEDFGVDEGARAEEFLGGGALLLVKDDVLVMWRGAEATVGGHGGAAECGGRVRREGDGRDPGMP